MHSPLGDLVEEAAGDDRAEEHDDDLWGGARQQWQGVRAGQQWPGASARRQQRQSMSEWECVEAQGQSKSKHKLVAMPTLAPLPQDLANCAAPPWYANYCYRCNCHTVNNNMAIAIQPTWKTKERDTTPNLLMRANFTRCTHAFAPSLPLSANTAAVAAAATFAMFTYLEDEEARHHTQVHL